jgi:hypothetical protein
MPVVGLRLGEQKGEREKMKKKASNLVDNNAR